MAPNDARTLARLFASIDIDQVTGCWNWTGMLTATGYGRFFVYSGSGKSRVDGRRVRAHRFTYEHFVGPVPEGLEVHHVCLNRRCCNPDHLKPLTHAENSALTRRDRCRQGHSPDVWIRTSYGRRCLACERERGARYRARLAQRG